MLNIDKELSTKFINYGKTYIHTTENIKGYLDLVDINNKSILTVSGSGEQMLNCFSMGANNVTVFDINILSLDQTKIKKAAVSILSYKEYIDFFYSYEKIFDYNLFLKIEPLLEKRISDYLDYIITHYTKKEIHRNLFHNVPYDLEEGIRLNHFMKKKNYEKLADILPTKNIEYLHTNLVNLPEHIMKLYYDFIILSNINDYLYEFLNSPHNDYLNILLKLQNNLNDNGVMQFAYLYDYYKLTENDIITFDLYKNEIPNNLTIEQHIIDSYDTKSRKDECLFLRKHKM